MHRILAFLIILSLFNCASTNQNHKYPINSKSENDYAFIGKKIEIIETANRDISEIIEIDSIVNDTTKFISIPMNYEYKAKYEIILNVYNQLPKDTIEFIVYDHYGRPKFEEHNSVLLYIHFDKNDGKYYHEKYKFIPVEKRKDGQWKGVNGKSLTRIINEHYD